LIDVQKLRTVRLPTVGAFSRIPRIPGHFMEKRLVRHLAQASCQVIRVTRIEDKPGAGFLDYPLERRHIGNYNGLTIAEILEYLVRQCGMG